MNGLGLLTEALEQRRKFIQGGDAIAIVEGNWNELWQVKTGRKPDMDLPWFLRFRNMTADRVELLRDVGRYMEPFNLAWCREQTSRPVIYFSGNPLMRAVWETLTEEPARKDEHHTHPIYQHLAANLDAMTVSKTGAEMYLDAKWLARADEKEILRYTPQGTHCALVTGCEWWALSVIAGGRWELIEQEVDPFFAAEYLAKCEEFWDYVQRDEEPKDRVEIARPKPQAVLRTIRLDDEFRDTWASFNWAPEAIRSIRTFVETEGAHRAHMASRDEINAVVPPDVGTLIRGRYKRTLTKAGAVRMTVESMKDEGK